MLAETMMNFRNQLQEQGIAFCYCGFMTEDLLLGIGNTIKRKLEHSEIDKKKSKSVFSIFVEQMQNVIRYSAERETQVDKAELSYGIVSVGESDGQVFVTCGNVIEANDVPRLKEGLDKIKSLDKKGLKALWKETLKGETPEGSKGAGVGFIDIARRAEGGIEFDFAEIDASRSFFTIKAFI
ncbi:SiaB family protein kinase [Desulfovibrio inopinatus]|uniref:SiaB family protein kinase n=1 Tax=Desulfovibrio inopinatus TaxID=102109 RepID=UPI00040875CC|nr:SiaB family protein kinase [Desulfovibrio inopinatus]